MHKSIAELIANQKPEKIRIIGHSMGGALAILAAIEFKAMNQSEDRKISCFTLAAPIIGDQRFSKLFWSLRWIRRRKWFLIGQFYYDSIRP